MLTIHQQDQIQILWSLTAATYVGAHRILVSGHLNPAVVASLAADHADAMAVELKKRFLPESLSDQEGSPCPPSSS